MLMTRTQVLQIFNRLRVWQQGDKRAPHKPLLLLLALGRLQRNEAPVVEFSQIDAPLKTLIDEFGPTGAGKNRHFPFWHLATDGDGGLWQLSGPANILDRAPGATPSLTELRQNHISAGFASGVQSALQHDPELLQEVARRLLNAHFPETLHTAILGAVGLTLLDVRHARSENADYRPRNRDTGFRERVLRLFMMCTTTNAQRQEAFHVNPQARLTVPAARQTSASGAWLPALRSHSQSARNPNRPLAA